MRAEYTRLNNSELNCFKNELFETYGFETPNNWEFRELGKNRVWLLSKKVSEFNTNDYNVESEGLYFAYFDKNRLRLSPEGAQLIGETASKNVLELNEDESEKIIRGFDIEKNTGLEAEYVILKTSKGILGVGKNKKSKVLCQFRKNRRIKSF